MGILLWSSAEQLRAPGRLASAIRSHRVFGDRAVAPVAATVVVLEVVIPGAVAGAAVGIPSSGAVASIAFASAGALFAVFTAYLAFLYRARPNADCGCSRSFAAVNFWTPIRAAVLALVALPPALVPSSVVSPGESATRLSISLLAAVVLAITAWILPNAMNAEIGARAVSSRAPAR